MPRSELLSAREQAKSLGLNYRVAEFSILKEEQFCHNPVTRCYICKKKSAAVLKSIAKEEGISCIADGVNLSDYGDYRPGIAACDEEGIWHPFVDAAITKEDIRALAHRPGPGCLEQAFRGLPRLPNTLWPADHTGELENGGRGRGIPEKPGLLAASGAIPRTRGPN